MRNGRKRRIQAQRRAGGEIPGTIAIPELREQVRKARRTNLRGRQLLLVELVVEALLRDTLRVVMKRDLSEAQRALAHMRRLQEPMEYRAQFDITANEQHCSP